MHHLLGARFFDRGLAGTGRSRYADQTTSGRVDMENGDSTIITEQTVRETGDFEVTAVVAVDNQTGTSGFYEDKISKDLFAEEEGRSVRRSTRRVPKAARRSDNRATVASWLSASSK